MAHDDMTPSDWVRRWTHLIPAGAEVLDLACGRGRHMRWLSSQGYAVLGVDRDAQVLAQASAWGQTLAADLEQGIWPLSGRTFQGVVVTHYLWRPTWTHLLDCLAPDGVLIYETFSRQQALIGKPSRDEFLLRPGELLEACQGLRVVAYEDGFLDHPQRFVQRIVAVRENSDTLSTRRYPLSLE
jgi:SAM-dependent methyltransferase